VTPAYAMSHLSAVNLACTYGRAGWMPTDPRHDGCRAWHGYIQLAAATYTTAEHWTLDGRATRV